MIDYNLLKVKRAIFHKVMARRREWDSYVEESKSLIDVSPEIEFILRTRMTDAFSQGSKAFELDINEVESGSAYSYLKDLCNLNEDDFINISIELAGKLAYCQDRSSIPHGFFLLLDCVNLVDNMPTYVLMKAEPHDALEVKVNSARVLKDIILSPSQKMYKAACFQKITNTGSYKDYKTYLFDEQFGARAQLAEYFYRDFLGLTVSKNDKVLTKMFFVKMLETIKDVYSKDYIKKDTVEELLKSEMKNQEKKLEPLKLIDRIVPVQEKDVFYRRVMNDEFPPSFIKNISLISDRLSKCTMSISDKIKISYPQELCGNESLCIDRESDAKYVIVKIPKS